MKKIGPGVLEKVVKRCLRRDGRTMEDGQQVITIAHPEHSAQVS